MPLRRARQEEEGKSGGTLTGSSRPTETSKWFLEVHVELGHHLDFITQPCMLLRTKVTLESPPDCMIKCSLCRRCIPTLLVHGRATLLLTVSSERTKAELILWQTAACIIAHMIHCDRK